MPTLVGSGGSGDSAETDWKCVRNLAKQAAVEGRGYRQSRDIDAEVADEVQNMDSDWEK